MSGFVGTVVLDGPSRSGSIAHGHKESILSDFGKNGASGRTLPTVEDDFGAYEVSGIFIFF